MLPTRYGRLAVDYHRRNPVSSEPYLPALLERKLRFDGSRPRVRPTRAAFVANAHDLPIAPRSLEEATNDVVKHIDANKDVIEQEMLRLRQYDMRSLMIARMVKQIFEFFDEFVFMNKLSGRVSFHGYAVYNNQLIIGKNDSGKTIATFVGRQTADIVLNSAAFETLLETREVTVAQDFIIAAVLHQMIHAYFIVACGVQSEEKKACALLSHDEHFGIVMYKIKRCSAVQTSPIPVDFGNTMPELAVWPGSRSKVWDTGGVTTRSSTWTDNRKTSTECARSVRVLKEEECKDWYKNKCLKTLDPDIYVYNATSRTFDEKPLSKCGEKADWVELLYKKKPYKVRRKAFEMYSSFKKKFEDSTRKLDVSPDVKKETFEELIRFLCEDSEKYYPPCLRMSIELYKLGLNLKFEELKEAMMDAIYLERVLHPTAEAVLEVVRAVYGMPIQPDGPLRDWAIGVFKSMGGVAVRMANRDPRLNYLRGNCTAFKSDLSRAAEELGPAALTAGNELCYAPQVGRQLSMSPAPNTLCSYTFTRAPIHITTTATPLSGAQHTPSVPYHLLPYQTPASPIYPARWRAPPIPIEEDGWYETVPWPETAALPTRYPSFGQSLFP